MKALAASAPELCRDRRGWRLLNPWLNMLVRPEVRTRVLAAGVLTGLLILALARCLSPEPPGFDARALARLPSLREQARLSGGLLVREERAIPAPLVGDDATQRNLETSFRPLGRSAEPFHFLGSHNERLRAVTCLAAAMIYEAGHDPAGQLAVGQVVLNRVRHPAFPGSVCGVVMQGSERATGCQFTFTCDGSLARPLIPAALAAARTRAEMMLGGVVFRNVGLATHYHTTKVYPWWSPRLEKIAQVGAHLFFRWPGYWGTARAMKGKRFAAEPSAALLARAGSGTPTSVFMSAPAVDPAAEATTATAVARASGAGPFAATPDLLPPRSQGSRVHASAGSIPTSRQLVPAAPRPTLDTATLPKALKGGRILSMFPETGTFYLALTPDSREAALRGLAQALCGGRAQCRVYGWRNSADVPQSPDAFLAAAKPPAFRFVREPDPAAMVPPSANAL